MTALNRITALKNAIISVYLVILGSPVPVMIIHQYGLLLGKSGPVCKCGCPRHILGIVKDFFQ